MSNEKVLNMKTGKMENCTVGAGCQRHAHSLENLKPLSIDVVDETTKNKYYVFSQNNTGGVFKSPAKNVIVQALSTELANSIAKNNGVYFDENYEIDCDCCGTRWDKANEYYSFDSKEEAIKASYVSDFDKEIPDFIIVEENK